MKLVNFTKTENIFIVCGKTDMRRKINGLAAKVIQEYDMNVVMVIPLIPSWIITLYLSHVSHIFVVISMMHGLRSIRRKA